MKKLYCIVLFAAFTLGTVTAQEKRRPRISPEEFRAKVECTLTEKVCLSEDEGRRLFPIYHEMKAKQHELIKQMRRLKKGDNSLCEKESKERVLQIKHIQVELAKIEEEYYKKMSEVIPACKLYRVMVEEDNFHREMLSKFNRDKERH